MCGASTQAARDVISIELEDDEEFGKLCPWLALSHCCMCCVRTAGAGDPKRLTPAPLHVW